MHENKIIRCDVCNCTYHDSSDHCSAQEISVGPGSANSSNDTVCNTFKCKDCK